MKTIYVVTRGSYSDYCIEAVFDNLEMAKKLASQEGYTKEIEEYPLNPTYIDYRSLGFKTFNIIMLKDGTVVEIKELEDSLYVPEHREITKNVMYIFDDLYNNYLTLSEGELFLAGTLIEKSREQAIKVANEKRIQILAENRWKKYESV